MRRLHLLFAFALVGCGGASETVVAVAPMEDAAVSDPADGSHEVSCPSCDPTPVGPPILPPSMDATPTDAGVDATPNDSGSPNDGGAVDGGTTDANVEAGHTDGGCGGEHHREARIHHHRCHRTPAHLWHCPKVYG